MSLEPVLRRATAQDSDLLFSWVNSPDSLSAKALKKEPIARADHEAWLARRLCDVGTTLHMIELEGISIGQVRLQQDETGAYTVDIFVDFNHRGQGLALWAVKEAVKQLGRAQPEALVVALVRVENQPSASLFSRAGFSEVRRSDTFLTFERTAPS